LSGFAGGAVAQQVAVAVTETILAKAFGPNIEVRQGGLNAQEFAFAKEVSQFTHSTLVGTPKGQPGIDGILSAPAGALSGYGDVRGVASLTETSRDNARVLLDLAGDKETSAKNAGNKNVDLFIRANKIDSKTALEFVQRGPGFTNVTSRGTIRSINIFTSDKKVVTISGNAVKVCDTKGKCQ